MKISLLQVKIMLALQASRASNLTQLAQAVGAQRPSVSRSIATLRSRGVVRQANGAWELTPDGRRLIRMFDKRAIDSMEDAAKAARRAMNEIGVLAPGAGGLSDALRALGDVSSLTRSAFTDQVGPAMNDLISRAILPNPSVVESVAHLQSVIGPSLSGLAQTNRIAGLSESLLTRSMSEIGATAEIAKNMSSLITGARDIQDMYSATISPLLHAQELSASLLGRMVTDPSRSLFADNNLLVAQTIANVENMYGSVALNSGVYQNVTAPFAASFAGISGSYEQLISGVVQQFQSFSHTITDMTSWNSVIVPSIAVAEYTTAVAAVIEEPPVEPRPKVRTLARYSRMESDVSQRLTALHPEFENMRQGAWQAIEGDNPDKARHAAISSRELMRHFLAALVPNVEISEDELGSKMKARVKTLLASK